ncbi:MAG: hypothetical protein E6Q97_36370 [Desulfurellales bacterium]|nr:MAG: hypothetical protein E6Q97_36370 [Desulfurellales bacterium]
MSAAENIGSTVPVGVWDQVVEFGQYQHETVNGEPCLSVHDATTCKVMMDDFAAHPDCDIFYDKQHEVVEELGNDTLDREKMKAWAGDGHALAWANALCMIIGGQVVRYEAHPGAPRTPPRADEVLVQSNGTRRPDGVFCLRSQVTSRGADPVEGLGNFRKTSPFYVPERDGNRLLNLTATNDPRMRGCALAFTRTGAVAMSRVAQETPPARQTPGTKETMDPKEMARLMEAAGCKAEDKPEEVASKMAALARKMEEDSKKEKEESAMSRKKMEDDMAEMRRKMEDSEKKKEPEAAARKAEDKHKEPDGDEGNAAMQAMSRRLSILEEKNEMLRGELSSTKNDLAEAKALVAETTDAKATGWAETQIAMGRIRGEHKGDVEKTTAWLAAKYKKDKADAEDLLDKEGTFKPSERIAMKRYTQGGAGIDQPIPRADELQAVTSAKAIDRQMEQAITMQREKLKKAGKESKYDNCLAAVKQENPTLFAQWNGGN